MQFVEDLNLQKVAKMLFLLYSFIQSYGFTRVTLTKDHPLVYNISNLKFYYSVENSNLSDFSFDITNGTSTNTFKNINQSNYYEIKADSVVFKSNSASYDMNIFEIDPRTCSDISYSLGLETYISITSTFYSIDDNLCFIFFQPGYVSRVITNCESDNPMTRCIVEEYDGNGGGKAVQCRANSTCSISVTNGFLITGYPHGNYINLTTQVINIKGEGQSSVCTYNKVTHYNINGIVEINESSHNISYSCQMKPLQIGLAVILVAIMFFTITCGFLMYYFCRPNRAAYESPFGDKKKQKSQNDLSRRHNSFNNRPTLNQALL